MANAILDAAAGVKREHGLEVLALVTLGEFVEGFGADAEVLARELNLSLTCRFTDGPGGPFVPNEYVRLRYPNAVRYPMAGFPVWHRERYVRDLVRKGYRVAVLEQPDEGGQQE